jgi:hypothetical protein
MVLVIYKMLIIIEYVSQRVYVYNLLTDAGYSIRYRLSEEVMVMEEIPEPVFIIGGERFRSNRWKKYHG